MNPIIELGAAVENAWREHEYDERAFPEIARQALETRAPYNSFTVADLLRWASTAPEFPHQPDSAFGEPPVTLYAGRRFYIEALFWLDGTTTIHQHGFSGAFQVVEGSSLHTRFDFTCRRMMNKSLVIGDLRGSSPELLRRGDTRVIFPVDGLIHSVFHLERPSVTLVVRTYQDPGASPQYRYLRPGIGVSSIYYDARLPRLMQLFETVFHARLPNRIDIVRDFLSSSDLHSSVLVLERLSFVPRDELAVLGEVVGQRHPAVAEVLEAAVAELRRQALIVQRRKALRSPDHRFLLALLLNVDSRDEIIRLVRDRTPGRDPVDQIVQWVAEMSPTADAASPEDHAMSYSLGEIELRVFRGLLEQRSVEEIITALKDDFDDVEGQQQQLRALCTALQHSALFRLLLRRTDVPRLAPRVPGSVAGEELVNHG